MTTLVINSHDEAIRQILSDTPLLELAPAWPQGTLAQNGENIGYKLQPKGNPWLRASLVLYPTAFDVLGGCERLTAQARGQAHRDLQVLCESWSKHEVVEVK